MLGDTLLRGRAAGERLPHPPRLALPHVWPGSRSHRTGLERHSTLFDPGLHFGQVPDDAAWSQIEAPGKLALLLELVDGRVAERHDPLSMDREIGVHIDGRNDFIRDVYWAGAIWTFHVD